MNRKTDTLSPFLFDATNLSVRKNPFGQSHFHHPDIIYRVTKTGMPSRQAMNLIFLLFMLILSEFNGNSQMPFTISESGSEYNRAMELFNKEIYPAAIR